LTVADAFATILNRVDGQLRRSMELHGFGRDDVGLLLLLKPTSEDPDVGHPRARADLLSVWRKATADSLRE